MKILVCLKQVPHKDARLELTSDGSWIQDANIKFEINDYDNYALEEALRIKDKDAASEVVVLSIGPDRVQQSLRTALGMGADRAVQIWDDGLAHADSLAIAKSIAGGLPLSAVTGRAELMDAAQVGGLGGTFVGNPVACAAALARLFARRRGCQWFRVLRRH